MAGKKTDKVWAGCLLALLAPLCAPASAATGSLPGAAPCVVPPTTAVAFTARQEAAVSKTGRIPGLGTVRASIGWDNRKQLTLISDGFEVTRSFTPLTREVTLTIAGDGEEPLVVRLGGVDGIVISRGKHVVRGTSDADGIGSMLGGRAIAAFRERIGNYERQLMTGRTLARNDDPHAHGFLLAGAFVASLAGDPTAVGRARDLITQRIRAKLRAVRFDFKDCVTDYELYLLDIDTQRTQCLDAANGRDSWYARAADRLGCEAEFIAQALAGEGQFISCTALGVLA
jgi:hypothetical protein